MDFMKEHFDEILLFGALLVFVIIYAVIRTPETEGWINNLIGALVLSLTGGGVKAALKNGNGK